jgi:hypothetical protein
MRVMRFSRNGCSETHDIRVAFFFCFNGRDSRFAGDHISSWN